MQKTTLLYLHKPKEKKILLAMKKRSFGEGKWNGVGGKLNKDETVHEALIRETREEIDVSVNIEDLIQVAVLDFSFENKPEWTQRVNVFFAEKWENEPTETEEMNPKWHLIEEMPYEKMWISDKHWLPLVLKGKKLEGYFTLNESGDEVLDMNIKET